MPERRFPPPWTVEETQPCFIVRDSNGQALAFVYFDDEPGRQLSRTYATLLEALNRHRGKGQPKVTVEHDHVHEGGQAIVGNVAPGGGTPVKSDDQPHAKLLAYAPGTPMPCADTLRDAVPIARNEERPLPDARRSVSRGSQGE